MPRPRKYADEEERRKAARERKRIARANQSEEARALNNKRSAERLRIARANQNEETRAENRRLEAARRRLARRARKRTRLSIDGVVFKEDEDTVAEYYCGLMDVSLKVAKQVMICEQNTTSESSESSHSDEESDTSVKLSAVEIKHVEEGKLGSASTPTKGINLKVPGEEHTDISSTPTSVLPIESGLRQPVEKMIERRTLEESLPDIPMDKFQKVCSTGYGSASTAGREDRVLNTFLTNNLDKFQHDIDNETTAEFESISYPQTESTMYVRDVSDKPYECKYCTRRFCLKSSLYRHQKSHAGEKLYKCTECSESFTSSSNLNVHSRIHTGEKPYECNECGEEFTLKFALDQHLKIHSQEKLYICSHCGKSFSDYLFLLSHQQMVKAYSMRVPDSVIK